MKPDMVSEPKVSCSRPSFTNNINLNDTYTDSPVAQQPRWQTAPDNFVSRRLFGAPGLDAEQMFNEMQVCDQHIYV